MEGSVLTPREYFGNIYWCEMKATENVHEKHVLMKMYNEGIGTCLKFLQEFGRRNALIQCVKVHIKEGIMCEVKWGEDTA